MKITQGYVAVNPDGQYLYINSHRGQMMEINAISDLEMATVRNQPGARDTQEAKALARHNVVWKPVLVSHEVTLKED